MRLGGAAEPFVTCVTCRLAGTLAGQTCPTLSSLHSSWPSSIQPQTKKIKTRIRYTEPDKEQTNYSKSLLTLSNHGRSSQEDAQGSLRPMDSRTPPRSKPRYDILLTNPSPSNRIRRYPTTSTQFCNWCLSSLLTRPFCFFAFQKTPSPPPPLSSADSLPQSKA